MLFNTLAYAKFFAIVFVVSWLLVRRSSTLWLGWVTLLAYALFGQADTEPQRPVQEWGLVLIALAFTAFLAKQAEGDTGPPKWRLLLASLATNLTAVAWLAAQRSHSDLLSLSLSAVGVPTPTAFSQHTVAPLVGALVVGAAALILLRAKRVRLLFILGASYVFYAHWDWRFLPLIFGSSTADYLLGLKIGHTDDPVLRKRWLLLTVLLNLGVLGFFKYLNFGMDTARAVLAGLNVAAPEWTLEVALPIGISFFTFESMSYVIDVYRRELPPHKSYLEYLSFVAFFPHLVAGPIVRPRDLLPQLGGPPRFSPTEGSEALFLIAWGLLKKVAIGDYLALNLVDRVFDQPIQYSALECYAAVIGYAVQIYCDFSGYTDVAIGSALLLGIRFPLNFNAPYKAVNIQDFWRRWHISLSTWLRDYLYVPLGGNRKGPIRTYVNLMLTMLLGGLWHGASWTFVVWGGLHGSALALNRFISSRRKLTNRPADPNFLRHGLSVFLTFHFVCVAWVFFRAPSFGQARIIFAQLGELTSYHPNLPPAVVCVLAVGLLTHFAPEKWYEWTKSQFARLPGPVQGLALAAAAFLLRELISAEAVPFVYFQF